MTATRLPQDVTVPATYFDPALTYYADGTPVRIVWDGDTREGVATGRVKGSPYDFQRVTWADGSQDNVAPHVLHPITDALKEH